MKNLGYNLRKIRELRNLDQKYVAGQLGVSVRTYAKMESGQKDILYTHLLQLAFVLNVTPEILANFDVNSLLSNGTFETSDAGPR